MSHHHDPVICPNCGYHATENYCARCGQETHLHKETFWGLVAHFIGHYFHYDSKFWQTLKALWFSPGKLTTAYWKNQRMRYIPPISLYIFISAVFFIGAYTIPHIGEGAHSAHNSNRKIGTLLKDLGSNLRHTADELDDRGKADTTGAAAIKASLDNTTKKVENKYGSVSKFANFLGHNIPKLFFLMIPLMALTLKLLFFRRKGLFFLHHSIFSLHYHCLWFSIFFISVIVQIDAIKIWLWIGSFIVTFIYMIAALHNVYNVKWLKATIYALLIHFAYGVFFFLAFIGYIIAFAMMA